LIREKAGKLDRICGHITSCRVAVEKPHRHQKTGNPYRVRIDMRVPPGHELVIKEHPDEGRMHDDLSVVLIRAFERAGRRLQKLVGQQQGEIKFHPGQQVMGFVERLLRPEGYGFLRTIHNREIYFHQNSVLNHDWERLEVGTGVHYLEEDGEEGPQATSVRIVDKPGVRVPRTEEEEDVREPVRQ